MAQRSFFELCAHDYYNRDRPNECRLKNYEFDHNIPRIKNFIECVFMGYKWVPHNRPYKVQPDKMMSDLKANGLKNGSDAQKVVTDCEKKNGKKIIAYDYFMCLYTNPKTKEGIMNWLKVKDGKFFKKC